MYQKSLEVLEYDEIVRMLVREASSEPGKELAGALSPSADLVRVSRLLDETAEAESFIKTHDSVPLGGIHEIRSQIKRARIGGTLNGPELLLVGETARASRLFRAVFSDEDAGRYPLLKERVGRLGDFRGLEATIGEAITAEGEIADKASPRLRSIRSEIRGAQARVRERLEDIVRGDKYSRFLQDPIVTMRGGRYVIPVKQEYRSQVPGLVHDQSASRQTLFVEPMEVLELNNRIKELESLEEEEIARVLRELTSRVAAEAAPLERAVEALAELDFIFARARLAGRMKAVKPAVNGEGRLKLPAARHPLLGEKAVPIDLRLGTDFDTLVITGPNTGGKTVTLKTCGLLALMAQSGLFVPAGPGCEVPVYRDVFCDIGDEQSIEQSLSTFSSHMTNIVRMISMAGDNTLVLLDEIGAGTDPAEGSALAMAILEYFQEKGSKTIATTHYTELKTFAYSRERVQNASVDFDRQTLRPTYHLLIGQPGSSNAFEISAMLGLPRGIVERAKSYLTDESARVMNMIRGIEEDHRRLKEERDEAEKYRRRVAQLEEEHRKRLKAWEERERRLLEKAEREAGEIVEKARSQAERILQRLKEAEKRLEAGDRPEKDRLLAEARRELKELRRPGGLRKRPDGASVQPEELRPGQEVFIHSLNQRAFVLEVSEDGQQAEVQVGIIKVRVPLSDVTPAEGKGGEKPGRSGVSGLVKQKAETVPGEIHLRMLRVEEALEKAEKYLDDAYLAGYGEVRIIHGKGTGALRRAIHDLLKRHPNVSSYSLADYNQGGAGVTVVRFGE